MTDDTDLQADPVLSTTDVAELFDVHPSTVKRWCDREELAYRRTGGGHRRIPLSEALGRARDEGLDLPLLRFGAWAGGVWRATRAAQGGDFSVTLGLSRRLLDEDDLPRLGDLFVHLGRHPDVEFYDVLDHGLRPLMVEIGEEWERGKIGPGIEHMVSEVVSGILHRLRRRDGIRAAARDAPSVALVGAAEGERHALGSRCVQVMLERADWEVRYLGGDVPMEEWSALQRDYGARMVCISFSRMRGPADLLRCVERLASSYERDHPYALALGGGARVSGPPAGAWPFSALRFFPEVSGFGAWLGETAARA